jgi:hypothetical protein
MRRFSCKIRTMIDTLVKIYARIFLGVIGKFYVPEFGTTILVVKKIFPAFAWAQAVNNVILIRENLAKEIFSRPDVFCNALGHELVHVYQFREHGFLKFVFKYFASSVYSFATGKHYYYNNVFEVEAYQKQGEIFVKST